MEVEAKIKAIELFNKFYNSSISTVRVTKNEAKQLSKMSINETISILKDNDCERMIEWLKEVKKEITKL